MNIEHLISKKELLARYGISYGALYRWKRKGLIPDEWFIKKSTTTGQETFFPEKLVCERIELIQEMKEAGFHMDDVYQGTNLTPVLHAFEGDLKDGKYEIGDNSLLESHLLNVAVDINANDSRMKPVKIEKRAHIDGAVSIFDALAVKMKYHKEIGRQLQNKAA